MPIFSAPLAPASLEDFEFQKRLGFTGTFDEYLEEKSKNKSPDYIFIRGSFDGMEHCHYMGCIGFNDYLCDYPVGDDQTCDKNLCSEHINTVGEDLHYCQDHYDIWMQQKPKELHVSDKEIGYLVDQVFYPPEKLWIAKNKAEILGKRLIRLFPEKE